MELELRNVLAKNNVNLADCSFGFHMPPFTTIPHLHMHAIGQSSKMGFLSRWIFKPNNLWYCSVNFISIFNDYSPVGRFVKKSVSTAAIRVQSAKMPM